MTASLAQKAARQSHNLKFVSSILTRGKFLFIESKYYIYKNKNFVIIDHIYSCFIQQSRAQEASWAHNPEVAGSKPLSAMNA